MLRKRSDGRPIGIKLAAGHIERDLADCVYAAQRVANYLQVSLEELKTFARITGHTNVHDLCRDDLVTFHHELAMYADITHV